MLLDLARSAASAAPRSRRSSTRRKSRSSACRSAQTKPVWNGKEFAPRLMLPLSLSYDHRVIDGASAARFTAYLCGAARRHAARDALSAAGRPARSPPGRSGDCRKRGGHHERDRSQGPRHRRLQGRPGHRDLREAGRHGRRPRIRSSRSNPTRRRWTCPSPAAGTVQGSAGQGRRQGQRRHADRRARSGRRGAATAQPARDRAAAAAPPRPATPPRPRRPPRRAARRFPAPRRYTGKADVECEMLVLGSGPGGYSAAFRAADLGMKTVLVERYATLGGVCLNVGCIPSKALLHVAAVMDEAKALAEHGIAFGAPKIDLDKLRGWKDKVVGKLTGGLAGMAKARKVEVVRGVRPVPRSASRRGRADRRRRPGRRPARRRSCSSTKAIIAAGSQVGAAAVRPRRPAHRRLDRRARAARGPEADAGRSAAASSASRWAPCTRRSARGSTSSRCSTA